MIPFDEAAPATIRPMTPAEVELAVDWAAAEGWNPGLRDAAVFGATDPGGFLVALRDGEPVASVSVVAYGEAFGFLGLYITRPDLRGQGIGRFLWQTAMARLGDRTVGLDGVVEQQANYRRSGFAFAHRNIRFVGTPTGAPPVSDHVETWDGRDFDALMAFDARHFPAKRAAFLQGWLSAPGHQVFLSRKTGEIDGYGVVRPCRSGCKIGPLFAAEPQVAANLFAALAGAVPPGLEITVDVPEPNAAAAAIYRAAGMVPVFETARMYRGSIPDLPLQNVFAITSFELG